MVSANRSGSGKEILLDALTATKPQNGVKFRKATGKSDIDVSAFFGEIAAYKAEFAFNLVKILREGKGKLRLRECKIICASALSIDKITWKGR